MLRQRRTNIKKNKSIIILIQDSTAAAKITHVNIKLESRR